MKKEMSIAEFREYCAESKPRSVLYLTENQSWYNMAENCMVKLSFPTIMVFANPNVICLKSGDNTLCIKRVTKVNIDTDSSVLGAICTVFCRNIKTGKAGITYTLVAMS